MNFLCKASRHFSLLMRHLSQTAGVTGRVQERGDRIPVQMRDEINALQHLAGEAQDVMAQLRVTFVRHRGTAHGTGGDRFFKLAVLGLHQGINFPADLVARSCEEPQEADELGEMVARFA